MHARIDPEKPRNRRLRIVVAAGVALLVVVVVVAVILTRGGPTSTIRADDAFVDVGCDGDGARGLVANDTDQRVVVGVEVAFVNDDGELLHRAGRTGIEIEADSTARWSVDYEPKFVPERLRGDHPNCDIALVEPSDS